MEVYLQNLLYSWKEIHMLGVPSSVQYMEVFKYVELVRDYVREGDLQYIRRVSNTREPVVTRARWGNPVSTITEHLSVVEILHTPDSLYNGTSYQITSSLLS